MAKKAELLEQAHKLKLEVGNSNTIAEIEEAIKNAGAPIEVEHEREADVAKAGKRSAKAIADEQEKELKVAKKTENPEDTKPKAKKIIPTRPKSERRSKNYKEAYKLIDRTKEYSVDEAVTLIKKTASTKFDSSVEIHVRLGVDPKHADQNIRESITLPAGTGKTVRVAVFGDASDVTAAKAAGADIAGEDDFLQILDKGKFDFEVIISTPKNMARLGKYAKELGPRGLMPNPKSGTVTSDVAKAVKEAKAGKIEYRVDSSGIVHSAIGKVSFSEKDLSTNISTILTSIKSVKPSSIKGAYITSIYLTTTMGPSVRLSETSI